MPTDAKLTLTKAQWRVIELLARHPRPNIYFDSRERWRACISPLETFTRIEVSSLFASKLVEDYHPTSIARPHLRLTPAGRALAASRFKSDAPDESAQATE